MSRRQGAGHDIQRGPGLIREGWRSEEQVGPDVRVDDGLRGRPTPNPGIDLRGSVPPRLLALASFDLVQHGASFGDIPLDQLANLLLHRPVVPSGERFERLNHLGRHVANGKVGIPSSPVLGLADGPKSGNALRSFATHPIV